MKWLIGLAIIVLGLGLGLGVKIAYSDWGKISPVEKYMGLLSEYTAFEPNAPISYSKIPTLKEIREELDKYDWDSNKMLLIMECESQFDPLAFNFETEAKKRNRTKFSSCGLLQINSPECEKNENLYDWKYNISEAYKVWKNQNYKGWINCLKKAG